MTDAAPHPLLGSTVQGFTLLAVRFTWPCATDFDASRPRPRRLTNVSEPGVPMRRRGAARQAHGCGTAPFEHVRIRVWHEPGATGSPLAPPSSDPPVQAYRAQAWLSRHSMMRRFLRRRGSSPRGSRTAEIRVFATPSPQRTRRHELDLASDHRIRSDIIARPIVLSTTDPSIDEPFGGCEAAIFPAIGNALGDLLSRDRNARADTVLAVLVPLLNGLIELGECGYRLRPLGLDALACDDSGHIVIIDAGRVSGSRDDRSVAEAERNADACQATPQELLAVLAPVVEELSRWWHRAGSEARPGARLAACWASWCDQIEGASARATLTLLEAQLVAWHAVEVRFARATHPAHPAHNARDAPPEYDEAAPTEVDAA